jgi:Leucine-rich repeat (LRR) protein
MDTLAELRAGRLAGATRLDLSCGLTEFPREIFDLADSLETLNLSGNALDALPDDLGRLHKLRVLFCSDNRFTTLPESIGQCTKLDIVGFKANRIAHVPAAALPPSLRWLILTDNQIDELPDTLGHCTGMQKLMLAGNRLVDCLIQRPHADSSNCCESPRTASKHCPNGYAHCRASLGSRRAATPLTRRPKTRPSQRGRCRMSPGKTSRSARSSAKAHRA